jgi:polysaccharide export outer membrane protein
MKRLLGFLFLITALLVSCVPKKKLTYLQEPDSAESSDYKLVRTAYKVQPNDMLSITVRSYDEETAQLFNTTNANQANALQAGDIFFYLQGYSVDLQGNIQMPILGTLTVLNLSIEEIQALIEKELANYFKEEFISVTVQLAGIRYSVVGEVNKPGRYVIYQNQATVLEALAQAGDITMVGNRKEVMIVRQKEGNMVQTIYVDLTDSDVINNPNYFLQPNDVINVMPLSQKSFGIGTTGFETFSQLFSVVVSGLTLIIALNTLNN